MNERTPLPLWWTCAIVAISAAWAVLQIPYGFGLQPFAYFAQAHNPGQFVAQPPNDGCRRARRREHGVQGAHFVAGVTGFRHGGHVGQCGYAFGRGDGENTQSA